MTLGISASNSARSFGCHGIDDGVDESGVAAKTPKWGNMVLSRSRAELWHKETSGHIQKVVARYDCDSDALLIGVEQLGDIVPHR